jgi:hypothetical protein
LAAKDPAPPSASKEPASSSASLEMLLIVILSALALAGLTASVVYRLSRSRQIRIDVRQRRAAIWEGVDEAPQPPWAEPVTEETAPRPHAVHSMASTTVPQLRHQKIEELLAQLVKQAQQSDA